MNQPRHWIFLRGLVRGRGHWADFPQKFQAKFPQDTYELIDLPGNGESYQETSPRKISEYVQVIRLRSQAIRDGKKIHLLALSLGGMVAVEWMQNYGNEIEKAFLVCTSAANMGHFYERFLPENYLKLLSLAKVHTAAEYEEKVLGIITNNQDRQIAFLSQMSRYSARYPMGRQNFLRQLFAASQARFPEVKPGAVVVLGSYGDRLVSPTCSLNIARAWGLKALMHPNAGHDIPIDDPDWVLEQMS